MTARWSAGENSPTVCDTDFSPLPASSSPTAPPGFSGAASGQKTTVLVVRVPLLVQTHTHRCLCVCFQPLSSSRWSKGSKPACFLTTPGCLEPPQPILPTTVSSAAPTTNPSVDRTPAPAPAKSAPAPAKNPPATTRSASAPVRSAPAPRSGAESSQALPEVENLVLEHPKEPESEMTLPPRHPADWCRRIRPSVRQWATADL